MSRRFFTRPASGARRSKAMNNRIHENKIKKVIKSIDDY